MKQLGELSEKDFFEQAKTEMGMGCTINGKLCIIRIFQNGNLCIDEVHPHFEFCNENELKDLCFEMKQKNIKQLSTGFDAKAGQSKLFQEFIEFLKLKNNEKIYAMPIKDALLHKNASQICTPLFFHETNKINLNWEDDLYKWLREKFNNVNTVVITDLIFTKNFKTSDDTWNININYMYF
jgi:hypothetical protein